MSSEVKRWKATERPGQGAVVEVVDYSDYAALEAENAALKHGCGMFRLKLENAEERRIQAERQAAILRQHKADYMEAAEGTRKALEAECERLADELARKSVITGDCIARCQRLADERDAMAAENARLRAELEQSRDLIVEMSKHCNATALVADWLERNQ